MDIQIRRTGNSGKFWCYQKNNLLYISDGDMLDVMDFDD